MQPTKQQLEEIPDFLKEMCSDLSDQELLEAYERLMELMAIAWRIHIRITSEQDILTDTESPIGLSDKRQINTGKKINDV